MALNEKVWASIKAHTERANYYYNFGAYKNKHLANYHSTCASKICELGRFLTNSEKKQIFNKTK